jgi:NitT/TauT family transport system substrate-binding protein
MKHIKVMLEYFHPWTNSAGFYVARERGWYRDAGLDVEFQLQDPERGDTLAYLSHSEVDFGIFPTNRLLVRRENGERVLGIAAINQRALDTIQTVKSTGISRPRDLQGKRVALNPTPRGLAMVRYLVEIDGGNSDAVQFVDVGARELTLDDIAAGEADASYGGYWAWEALRETRIPADQQTIWPVDELGAPRYHGYLLGAHENLVQQQAGLVQSFLDATARGYLATAQKPEIAQPIYERVAPYIPRKLWKSSLPLIASTWLCEGHWGEQREELLAPYAEWLVRSRILSSAEVWKSAVTNAFLPTGQTV